MAQMLAMVQENGESGSPTLSKKKVSKPKPASDQALVKVSYVAQNPTDSMAQLGEVLADTLLTTIVLTLDSNAFGEGTVLGCDFVGTVEDVGDKSTRVQEGDVIAGLIWGGKRKTFTTIRDLLTMSYRRDQGPRCIQ
jgi:NADPH:quinone reductase-like Zn-dependent oxidoreductase